MVLIVALTVFLTFSSQTAAEEGDTITPDDNEVIQQVPQTLPLIEEDGGTVGNDTE